MRTCKARGVMGEHSGSAPLVSVITVVRNAAATVERCLQSMQAQEYGRVQYIVYDGASTDGTQSVIARYRHLITEYRSLPDNGPYDAAMQALQQVTGSVVGFLMADDWLSPGALGKVAEMYVEDPEADLFCFGMQEYTLDTVNGIQKSRVFVDPPGRRFTLRDGLYCHGVNRFYSVRLLKQEPFRSAIYPQMADRDLYVRLGLRSTRKVQTSEILYHFLAHPGSNTAGGSAEKVVRMLDETSGIAREYLGKSGITPRERRLLLDWYCFNRLRMCWFLLKCGRPIEALSCGASLAVRYPLRATINVFRWRIPKELRPEPVQ